MLLEQRILDLQKDKSALIDKVRELKNEVARLTNENKILKQDKTNVFTELNKEELEKENAELIKAKEIIKKFLEFINNEVEFDPEHPQEHTDLWNELCEQAEQFISEV